MCKLIDLTGSVFGRWLVIGRSPGNVGSNVTYWDVECSCGNIGSVCRGNLIKGLSKSCGRCEKLVSGFGVLDVDYVVNSCPFYLTWRGIIHRCYSEYSNNKHPTYIDKTVSEEWRHFSRFKSWMENHNWNGMQLDKDLLVLGNTVYGPQTCWFLPSQVNKVLAQASRHNSNLPLGVTRYRDGKRFVGRCVNVHLGLFDSAQEAHKSWQEARSEHIARVVEWWQFDSTVNHTFNDKIADNLFQIRERILQDSLLGLETKVLNIGGS